MLKQKFNINDPKLAKFLRKLKVEHKMQLPSPSSNRNKNTKIPEKIPEKIQKRIPEKIPDKTCEKFEESPQQESKKIFGLQHARCASQDIVVPQTKPIILNHSQSP